jgi:ESCRT-I complex subunit TSG101
VPPNPEKDALLHALSQTLVAQTRQTLDSNNAALTPLFAQQNALRSAHPQLSRELEELSRLDAAIDANERVLRDAMRDADVVIVEAAGRKRPEIDEVLCAPTAVGRQVYELVAEKAGCEAARVALGRALDRGRVPCEVWTRQIRGVAREEFLKMVVVRKIARGLGLEMRGVMEEGGWR